MPIVASDLVAYASANMPTADTGTAGGAIDPLRRVVFTQLAANDTIQALSSAAGDTTQTITVVGRNAAGAIVTGGPTALTGTTPVTISGGTFERVLSVEMSAAAAGTVTIRRTTGAVTIGTIPIGERGFMTVFQRTASDPAVQKDYYSKIFLKNNHATLSLLSAVVSQSADPANRITFALAAAVNDSGSVANRVTSPGLTFNDTAKNVPGTDLAAGAAIGVWLNLTLPAADTPWRSTFDIQLAGQSV